MLLAANPVNLPAIASVGSAASLIGFLLVGPAGYRRRADTGGSAPLIAIAIASTVLDGTFRRSGDRAAQAVTGT